MRTRAVAPYKGGKFRLLHRLNVCSARLVAEHSKSQLGGFRKDQRLSKRNAHGPAKHETPRGGTRAASPLPPAQRRGRTGSSSSRGTIRAQRSASALYEYSIVLTCCTAQTAPLNLSCQRPAGCCPSPCCPRRRGSGAQQAHNWEPKSLLERHC